MHAFTDKTNIRANLKGHTEAFIADKGKCYGKEFCQLTSVKEFWYLPLKITRMILIKMKLSDVL
jgi:hypothetical protein